MNKIAVFGNAGGGKSTLSKRLTEMTGLPMVALDLSSRLSAAAAFCPDAAWFDSPLERLRQRR